MGIEIQVHNFDLEYSGSFYGVFPYADNYGYRSFYNGWPWPYHRNFYPRRRESPFFFHRNGVAHIHPPIAVLVG